MTTERTIWCFRSWRLVIAVAGLAAMVLSTAPPARACGGTVWNPFCAKTLVLSMGSSELLLTGGGAVDLPTLLYFDVSDFPAGAGLCPPGPFDADIDVTSVCDVGGTGTGGLLAAPIAPGFTALDTPFTLPAGPPRLCTLTATATALLADGMELTTTSDTVLCVADPAPGNPSLPRIDLELVGDPDLAIQRVHPGDQASYTYRVTNNDPAESFDGLLEIVLANTSRLPAVSGPMPPGTGVYSVSDPVLGDHFPIAFADELGGSCVPLPPNPLDPTIPRLERQIVLPPGASEEFELLVRPWGMCANGSCGRARLVLDGMFSDASRGVACAGLVTAADTTSPSQYAWEDGGQAVLFPPPPAPNQGFLIMDAEPIDGLGALIDLQVLPPQILIEGQPLPGQLQPLFAPLDQHSGRAQFQMLPDSPFPADAFFDLAYQVQIQPNPGGPPIETELLTMQLEQAGPTGFQDVFPFGLGQLGIRAPGTPPGQFDGFIELMPQMSGVGIDNLGDRHPMTFQQIELVPLPGGAGFEVRLSGLFGPGAGNQIEVIEIRQDFRGFAFEAGRVVFADGFERGDTTAWSALVP